MLGAHTGTSLDLYTFSFLSTRPKGLGFRVGKPGAWCGDGVMMIAGGLDLPSRRVQEPEEGTVLKLRVQR